MASKLEIKQYAVNWLRLYPDRSEEDTRASLRREFLGERSTTKGAGNGEKAGAEATFGAADVVVYPFECLVAFVLAVWLAIGRWWSWANLEQTQDDIDAVMANLREEGYWGDPRADVKSV